MQIQEIETVLLCHHPDNPRQSYKDIDDLKESIANQGILQPLTVVQIGLGRHYNVVAGNRRLEAAKAAGLKKCPCIVTEMTEKEQAAAMLIENMQRKNLTPYEECKGVQMCLDLGLDEDELSKKTGFSKETIRHRKKMSELDQGIFKQKCEEGQITMQEIIALEKIKDPATRNKVLESAGSVNFNNRLSAAVNEEKMEEERQAVYEILKSFAEEEDALWADNSYYQVNYHVEPDFVIPDDASEGIYTFKLAWKGARHYALYKKRPQADDNEEAEVSEYEKTRTIKRECDEKLNELGKRFFEMRKEFMTNRGDYFDGNITVWLMYLLIGDELDDEGTKDFPWCESIGYTSLDLFKEVYMETENTGNAAAYILDCASHEKGKRGNLDAAITLVYAALETHEWISCKSFGQYTEDNKEYERLYAFMERCGYRLSDEERKVLDGTHEYYYKEDK